MTASEAGSGAVELSAAIAAVRDQLIAAQTASHRTVGGRVVSFAVGKVTLEFTGEMKTTAGGSGGVRFHVFTAEAKADAKVERTRGATQKVIVELAPLNSDGTPFRVRGGVDSPPSE